MRKAKIIKIQNQKGLALSSSKGFTLIELLIYTALTAIIVGLFGAILITVTRIQGHQNSSVQITREMNFLVNAINNRVRDAHSVSSPSTNQLTINTPTYPGAPTLIYLEDSQIKVNENAVVSVLSSSRILVDSLVFTIQADSANPSSTSVLTSITASFNTTNPQSQITRSVQTSASPLLLSE
ncbi:MAG: hypothetical protein COU10_03045 [Candidatus Harrisonbacteria bacterium CG10_big_fil_rev_8_21_14_0_10_45_28]|uniref:Type II secretion system protein n=1 Tax=Candidatus Harrisonbacteria bacterium CG10_big_fil_rev_8_21_14_0_10_45_28 TaxID=1974586 RepID=A0A2H0UMU8_9BACT|nr:MAG: hypothetical protein COU10_03045 [Candidatus Harrisonbacteria bacterium CG10_big_fil_rev_8_21_14_0_10_45_28]